jgi:acetyl esterase
VLLHAHGGGFRIGTPEDGAGHLDQLAHGADAVVVSIDYRLIPEHPYPAALDDVRLSMEWVTEHADRLRVDPSRVALAGGSAGGNLALAAALARPESVPPLRFLLLEEPWLDLSDHPPQPRATRGFYKPFIAELQRCRELYCDGRSDDDPGVSPGLAPDLSGLPPTALLVGDLDLLVSQHRRFIHRLREQGIQASMYVFPGLVHGTHGMTRIGGAREYETVAIAALRSAFWL